MCAGVYGAGDAPWQLQRDRDGIKVYTRTVAGSKYKAVKATMTIHTSLSAVAALVRDTSACPKWQALCKSARGIKILSPQDMYVYQVNNLPWPVSDRDVVAHIEWRQDKKTLAVTMKVDAVSGMMPRQAGLVRVTRASSLWTFEPVDDGMVKVTTQAHINPGGPIPAWLINMLLVNSPYKTLTNMRRILGTGRYDDAKLGFIEEPKS